MQISIFTSANEEIKTLLLHLRYLNIFIYIKCEIGALQESIVQLFPPNSNEYEKKGKPEDILKEEKKKEERRSDDQNLINHDPLLPSNLLIFNSRRHFSLIVCPFLLLPPLFSHLASLA